VTLIVLVELLLVMHAARAQNKQSNKPQIEQIRRKIPSRGSTPENAPRIRAGMEKKDQKAELKKKKNPPR
jgi:hypothetical protein